MNKTSNGPDNVNIQRLDEWNKLDEEAMRYHSNQWNEPKQSTIVFDSFVSDVFNKSKSVIDMGAGAGAATAYLARNHKNISFTGFDYSEDLVRLGSKIAHEMCIGNLKFQTGDWYHMSPTDKYDGCISLQTLSWLPDYEKPLIEIFEKVSPNYLAITSLFYEGDITCKIEVEEHKRIKKSFYNIYSLPAIDRFCKKNGYVLTRYQPFEIDIDIARPSNLDFMGTYTKRVYGVGKKIDRIQISGPILMSWYMILMEKI